MTDKAPFRSACPISITLDILGDRWSLLILRDMIFQDACRFGSFAAAEERIATNILSDRLRHLQAHGIIVVEPDPEDGRKRTYRLTEKGWGLAPVLLAIIEWSAAHHETAAPAPVLAAIKADPTGFIAVLRQRSSST